jgi:hypothetical protein
LMCGRIRSCSSTIRIRNPGCCFSTSASTSPSVEPGRCDRGRARGVAAEMRRQQHPRHAIDATVTA